MADSDYVDGSGWISDESDFYGSVSFGAKLEKRVARGMKRPSESPFAAHMAKRVKLASEPAPSPASSTAFEAAANPSEYLCGAPSLAEGASLAANSNPKPQIPPDVDPDSMPTDAMPAKGVLDFLKSRPQISAMQKTHTKDLRPAKKEVARIVGSKKATEDLIEDTRFKGDPSAWQQTESVEDFLRRAPVLDPSTAKLGPWLWVRNPKISYQHRKHEQKTDVRGFVTAAEEKLEEHETQTAKIESAMAGKAPGTITRKLRPYREQLEDDLLSLAVKHAVTCGKWMFFPSDDDLPWTWRLVAEATAAGKLGPTSKVSTKMPSDPGNVICVYTYDFSDNEDVSRVVKELNELDLVPRDGKSIYYKCDAYTYLNIKSDNPYKVRASLYSSKDVLKGEVKAKDDGPIARLKKRNATIDTFLQS